MSARASIRRLRLYYKAFGLFRRAFADYLHALWFPFFGSGAFVARAGSSPVQVPPKLWTMLPTAARLSLLGAQARWDETGVHVAYNGMQLVSPPFSKMVATSLHEIFVEDVYRIRDLDLAGQVVLDVGAYIGDSSIAFAQRGATVHAFEPEARCHPFLRENVRLNGLEQRVHVHTVGLSDRQQTIESANGPLQLVDAQAYLRRHGVERVDIMKLDCEGCEYELFRPGSFLLQLQPRRIVMEYHRGGGDLFQLLGDHGYTVDWPERQEQVGYLYAQRAA